MTEKKKDTLWTRDLKIIMASCLMYMASLQMVTPLLAGFTGTLGANGTIMGIISALLYYSALVCRPIVGYLTDNVNKFKLAIIGLSMMILGPLGYTLAQSYVVVVISRILNGIGYATCSLSLTTWISLLMPKDKVGTGMGMFGIMNAIAMTFSPFMSLQLYDWFGYRVTFAIVTGFAVTSFTLLLLVKDKSDIRESLSPALPDRAAAASEKKRKPLRIIYPKVIYLAIVMLLFSIPQFAHQVFIVGYVERMGLEGLVDESIYFPVYAIALFILRSTIKGLFDKVEFKYFLYISCACTLVSMACLTFMKSNLLLLAAAVFMSGGFGIQNSVCQAQSLTQAGEGRRGLANSTYYLGLDLGFGFGGTIAGLIYDHLPIQYFYPTLAMIVPLALLTYFSHTAVVKLKSGNAAAKA